MLYLMLVITITPIIRLKSVIELKKNLRMDEIIIVTMVTKFGCRKKARWHHHHNFCPGIMRIFTVDSD